MESPRFANEDLRSSKSHTSMSPSARITSPTKGPNLDWATQGTFDEQLSRPQKEFAVTMEQLLGSHLNGTRSKMQEVKSQMNSILSAFRSKISSKFLGTDSGVPIVQIEQESSEPNAELPSTSHTVTMTQIESNVSPKVFRREPVQSMKTQAAKRT